MTRRWVHMVIAAVAILGLLACAGKRQDEPVATDDRSSTQLPEVDGRNLPALGQELMLALAQARNHHHKADIYIKDGQFEQAIASVRAIESVAFPADAAEAEDVKLDARARLAKLLVTKGDLEGAMRVVRDGIASASRESFFVANLYTVKGEVHEAEANVLDDDQSPEGKAAARAARISAIKALDRSNAINMALQKALMDEVTP